MGHKQGVFLEIGYEPGFPILARAQNALGIGKAKLPGQGAGGSVHRALDRVETSLVRVHGSIGEDKLDAEFFLEGFIAAIPAASGKPQIFGFGDGAAEQDRVDVRDGAEQCVFTAPDQAADFLLRRPDKPFNRRIDSCIRQIELRLGNQCIVSGDLKTSGLLSRQRIVEFLLADGFLLGQRFVSRYIIVGFVQSGFGGLQVGLRLSQRRLKRLGVDLVKELSLFNKGTFGEVDRGKIAFHARADFHVLGSQGRSDKLDVNRHVLLDHRRYLNFRWRRWRGLFLRAAGHGREN